MNKEALQTTINKAKKGDQSAYRELLNLYWGDVYRILLSKCQDDYDAEDITIKTFSRAFDKLNTYDPKYTFKNWLLTISNNLYIDLLRSRNKKIHPIKIEREKVLKIPNEDSFLEDKLIREQQLFYLLEYIKQLKPHYREVIHLRYFQEYSYKEMAEEMGESVSTVKVRLLRARRLLSELIAQKNT